MRLDPIVTHSCNGSSPARPTDAALRERQKSSKASTGVIGMAHDVVRRPISRLRRNPLICREVPVDVGDLPLQDRSSRRSGCACSSTSCWVTGKLIFMCSSFQAGPGCLPAGAPSRRSRRPTGTFRFSCSGRCVRALFPLFLGQVRRSLLLDLRQGARSSAAAAAGRVTRGPSR